MSLNKNFFFFIVFALLAEISQAGAVCESLFASYQSENQFFKPKTALLFQPESLAQKKEYSLKPSDNQFDSWYLPKAISPWKPFINSYVHIYDNTSGLRLSQMVFDVESIKTIHPHIHNAISELQKLNLESKFEFGKFITIYKNEKNEKFIHVGHTFTSNSKTAIHIHEIDYALDQIPLEIRQANPNQKITLDEVWVMHNHTTLSPLSSGDFALASEGLFKDQWNTSVTIRMMAISKDQNILFSKSFIKKAESAEFIIP